MNERPMQGRVALITGASRGIGRAVALRLARVGAHVVAVARTSGALEELDDEIREIAGGEGATLVPLDLAEGDGIDRLGAVLYERYGRLDAFFANAGVLGPLSPLGHIDPKDWQRVIDINITAQYRCVRSFDPLLKRSDAGRVVFTTSRAGWYCKAYWGGYAVSKAALECMARIYAHECENTPVRVNILNPGPIRTAMRAKAFPGEDPEALPTPDDLAAACVRLFFPETRENGAIFSFVDGELKREER